MLKAKIFILLGIAILIAGCVPSLYPLYTAKDIVFEPALLGLWVEENGENTWEFQKGKENSYEVVYTEKGVQAKFEAHLLGLGKLSFIDIFPQELDVKNDLYKFHFIRAHSFSRVWIEGDELRLAMLDDGWLKKMLEQKKVKITYENSEDGILFTAPTKELQKFVLTYAEDNQAFSQTAVMHRKK